MTFLYTVAFHRLALNRRGNILGGIIGIHRNHKVHSGLKKEKQYKRDPLVPLKMKNLKNIIFNSN